MKTMTATCTGRSFPASTIIQWAPNAQRCSGRRAIHVCALIDMRILSHFTSGAYFSPILIADVLIPGQPTRGRPGSSLPPSGAPPRRPLSSSLVRPCIYLHRVHPAPVPYPVRRSYWSLSSVVLPLSAYPQFIEPNLPAASGRPRRTGSSSALQRWCLTTAMATNGGSPNWSTSPRFAATPLPACNGYAGLIRVLLAIHRALSVCVRGRAAFVLPSFTEPRLIVILFIYQLTLYLEGFRRWTTMQHGEGVRRQSVDDVFSAFLFQCLRCSPSSFVKWFLAYGGSVDIADSDGMAVRYMATRQKSLIPGLAALIAASDRERKKAGDGGGICAPFGREAHETMKYYD
ncbi:hypothetical protein DFH08DRAFT_967428 [Mycena albidolilacea]|uniref:Uncharacterized protein n=1 Tax=Mycena albidolilacea TaxID=1033008 RepID=A0AAD6ZLF0_9AGAR|nr:hypothetical protein DFH08DRAFT_967428 [Mycena albidolilacea]